MRKIILNLAISLDGYICDDKGGFDWIIGQGDKTLDTEEKFDFNEFLESIDTVVMGSKSYEDCVLTGLSVFHNQKLLVATSRTFEERENVEFINKNICEKVLCLKNDTTSEKDIWLFGGATLTNEFIQQNIVDKYIIAIIPTILGNGRRLFKGDYPKVDLSLKSTIIDDGITILTYEKR